MNDILHGIPFSDYLQHPGLSASRLKILSRSPLAYRYALDHPDHESTPSQALGTAVHTAILEPDRFHGEYTVWDGGARRGKDWEAFKARHADRAILTSDEFNLVIGMRDSVMGFEPARRYLSEGQSEVTMVWKWDGRLYKGRADRITTVDGCPVIVDIKTTKDARPFKFGADAFRFGYHIQFALYHDGYQEITGKAPRFIVIAVESKEPFEPAVFEVPVEVIERGRDEYMHLVSVLDECEASNHWPPACETEQRLTLPAWAYDQEDEDLSDLGLTA